MLSESSRPIIESTLQTIAERINDITVIFYRKMFEYHPELMDGMFSRADQAEGIQPRALAGSVPVFASYILANPDSYPDEMLARIAHKHASLGVTADQYEIVYKYLFAAIAENLGDACTPEIAEAWTEVYWLMADVLVKIEKGLYDGQKNDVIHSNFKLVSRKEAGTSVLDMIFEPADSTVMSDAVAGQYVTVIVKTEDGLRQPRQYTLLPSAQNQRRIAVKQNEDGEVSPMLHKLEVGDIFEISNPYGDVVLGGYSDQDSQPLYLFSAGIGIVPMVAFLAELKKNHSKRSVVAVHADSSSEAWPLREEYLKLVAELDDAKAISFLKDGEGDFQGEVRVESLDMPRRASVYMCGPLSYMQSVRSALVQQGIPGRNIQYEIFGPDQWILRATRRSMRGNRV